MGVFITFEGLDGSGKSTQLQLLLDNLHGRGIDYIFTREPGGTPLAERIRELLLDPNGDMTTMTEALLFAASRADHVAKVIRPALDQGKVVICDRFVDASIVYQGFAGRLPVELLVQINNAATGTLKPDLTIVLDLPLEVARARRAGTGLDRMEQKNDAFHNQVRLGYLELARNEPDRVKVVDASGRAEEVQAQIRTLLNEII